MNRSVPVFSTLFLKRSCRPSMMNLARKPGQKMGKRSIYSTIITRFSVPSSRICLWHSHSRERVLPSRSLPPLRHSNGWTQKDGVSSQQMFRGTFAPFEWREAIDAAKGHTAKHLWELCLADQMRKLLRSSDLSVPGSRQHKVWTSYLHTPASWAERKASWFTRLPASQSADAYLDLLEERYRTTLKTVLDGWESNDFAEMVTKDGKAILDLSKDEKLLIPATVEPLREALLRVMPHARLADVFIEVDDWVGLRSLFTHLNERESAKSRDPRVDVALFAALLAHGLNLPLSTMAEATDIPYHELTHVSDWFLREETLRRAIVALVDYHHSLPLSAAFGPGAPAMSDGI